MTFRSFLSASFSMLLAAAPAAHGQQPRSQTPTLDQPEGGIVNRITNPYRGRSVAPIDLGNSGRLETLLRAGRIYISLQDAIALALENNVDIAVQRYGPLIAEQDLRRAQAGGAIRGLGQRATGGGQNAAGAGALALQNQLTGGGGIPGGGGTVGGNFIQNGPLVSTLDPVISGTVSWGHSTRVLQNALLVGTNALVTRNSLANLQVQQNFLSGTSATLSFNNNLSNQNAPFNQLNPTATASADLFVSQRLLQGFGFAVNNRFIRIARNNVRQSDFVFREQVINTISNVITTYYDLVSFSEDVAVRRQALQLAEKLYSDNRKQVEIGTLAPIEIVRAEAEVAQRQQELTVSETNLLQQETLLKNVLSRTGVASSSLQEVRLVPTDRIRIPDVETVEPIQDLFSRALANRPELVQSNINLENSRISLQGSRNALLPSVDAFADFRNNGLAGQINTIPQFNPVTGQLQPVQRSVNDYLVGGYGNALTQVFRRNFPDYSVGLQLNIPIRNRAAQADYVRDQLNLRQAELQVQRQINQIRVDVQNALIALQQARARYQAAVKNRQLQEQTLDAEQKKYALGASTIFFVIQTQRDLAQARAAEVTALSTYARARNQLDLATGQILSANNISMDEAVRGQVARPSEPIVVDPPNGTGTRN